MKKIISFLVCAFILAPNLASAVNYQIIGQDGNVIASGQQKIFTPETVLKFTNDLLKELHSTQNVNWFGTTEAIIAIDGLVQKTVAPSFNDTKAYGWCFKVNETLSAEGAAKTGISDKDSLTWYYGYTQQVGGEWQTGCTPASSN